MGYSYLSHQYTLSLYISVQFFFGCFVTKLLIIYILTYQYGVLESSGGPTD